jgi:hypothetical protein
MYLTEKSNKTYYKYHTLFTSLLLKSNKKKHKTKRFNFSLTGFFKIYWKYYNLNKVFIVQPNQITYTNLDWTEKKDYKNNNS